MRRGKYSNEEIEFITQYSQILGYKKIAEKLDRSLEGLKSKINSLGLPLTNKCSLSEEELENIQFITSFIKLDIDFSISNNPKELAYFLGFFWSDGYIREDGGLIIEIVEEDGEVLKPIFDKIASFSIYKRKREGRKPQMSFYQLNPEISSKLRLLGKYPHSIKSHDKIFQFIPKKFHVWFLRGLIDGDGCFYFRYTERSRSSQFSISGALNQDWSGLLKILKNYMPSIKEISRISDHGNSSIIRCTNGTEISNFISTLYEEKDNIWLPRKYEKALTIKEANLK